MRFWRKRCGLVPGYGFCVLVLSYAVLVANDSSQTWYDRLYYVVDRTAWHNATARPPVILALVLFGWSFVVARCRSAGLKLELVMGPGPLLPARSTFRSALVLLDLILLAHLLNFLLEPFAGAARPVYLACDVFLVLLVAAAFCAPAERGNAPSPRESSGSSGDDSAGGSVVSRSASFDDAAAAAASLKSSPKKLTKTTSSGNVLPQNGSNEDQVGVEDVKSGGLGEARIGVLRAIRDALGAPFSGPVTFWHVIVADYATSLAKALSDLQITACVVASALLFGDTTKSSADRVLDPTARSYSDAIFDAHKAACAASAANALCLALPFWCRLNQCLRCYFESRERKHLVNALKYCSAFPLVAIGYVQNQTDPTDLQALARHRDMLVVAAFVNSSFSFCWDVAMDWGLLTPKRRHLVLADRSNLSLALGYVALLAFNLATRFAWAVAVFTRTRGKIDASFQMFVLEVVEVLRRTVWAIFRVEHEYLNLPARIGTKQRASSREAEDLEQPDHDAVSVPLLHTGRAHDN